MRTGGCCRGACWYDSPLYVFAIRPTLKRHPRSSARNRGAARGWSRARRWPTSGRVSGCGRRRGPAAGGRASPACSTARRSWRRGVLPGRSVSGVSARRRRRGPKGLRRAAGARRATVPWWPASCGQKMRRSTVSVAVARRFRMDGGQPGPARAARPWRRKESCHTSDNTCCLGWSFSGFRWSEGGREPRTASRGLTTHVYSSAWLLTAARFYLVVLSRWRRW